MKSRFFNIARIINILPLKIKIALVSILGFAVCVAMLLYISLSKLSDLYNKTYQTNLFGNLASASFILRNFQEDLDQSAARIVSQQAFLDIFKEEDPDLVAVYLEQQLASEPLDLAYITWVKNGEPFLWSRGHNFNAISSQHRELLNQVIWQQVKDEFSNAASQAEQVFHAYLPLSSKFLKADYPGLENAEEQLVYIQALPVIVWREWRGLAIFGTIMQNSAVLKERLSEILGIPFGNELAFQLKYQDKSYLEIAHPDLAVISDGNSNLKEWDKVQSVMEPYPLEIVLLSNRSQLTQEMRNKVTYFFSFIAIISIGFVTLLSIFLSKVLGSLEDLLASSKLMKQGIYSARMKVRSEDELGKLASHFNEMAQSIEEKVQTIKEQSRREKLLRKLQYEAELSHLKNQMKPHFLFNTLHMIASLIELDRNLALEATYLLAELYRLILQSSKALTSTLRCELDILENYLEIQRLRFGERLNYNIETKLETEQIYVPQLVLQTLVENAVKHGIEKSIDGGSIVVKVSQVETELYQAQVINTGSLPQQDIVERTGIRNTRLMLKHLYGNKSSFKFETTGSGLVVASFLFTGEKL